MTFGLGLAIFTVILSVLLAIELVLYAKTCGWRLLAYCLAPLALITVHIIGDFMQELDVGPEWVQSHLHNIGVSGLVMLIGSFFWPKMIDQYERRGFQYDTASIKTVQQSILWGWMCGILGSCLMEIANVTLLREQRMAQGYSGELDWLDISAYFIGGAIVIINHRLVGPYALRRKRR